MRNLWEIDEYQLNVWKRKKGQSLLLYYSTFHDFFNQRKQKPRNFQKIKWLGKYSTHLSIEQLK